MRRRRSLTPLLVLLAPLLLILGIWLGGHPDNLPGFARDALVGDSQGRLYDEALDAIADNYYRPVDKDKLLDEGLTAGIKSLDDRFSAYFDPKTYKEFEEATEGAFEGVGLTVAEDERGLRVVTVFDGSPARRAGIRSRDVITAVDGESLAGKTTDEATTLIKGPAGSTVSLTVVTGKAAPRTLKLRRARVDVPVVESELRRADGAEIAHVRLSSFTSGAHGEVRKAVDELLDKGAEGVVLDLRDNGGGLLNEAVLVSSIFVGDGTIVSTKGRTRARRVFEASGNAIDGDIPVVVLVNGESASASEIVAGALQDRKRAEVVGTRTFGKGVFQEVRPLSNGGALDITVGEYFTPGGRNLGGGGVKKGAGIEPEIKARDDTETEDRDEALEVALRTVAREAA
ncbi:MAG: S41 family peptidase [Solirubrobacterales bacterium]|nr:S41 family peptidase [Solirubrobacterales bacterium]